MPLMNNPERRKEMKRRTCTTCVFNLEVLIFRFWQIRSPSAPSKNWPFQGRQLLLSENHLFKSCMKRFLLSRHFTLGDNTLTIHLCYIEVDNILEETLISSCLGSCSATFCAVSQFHHLLFCLGVKCRFRSMTFLFWYCIELLMPFWEETKICWVYPLQLLWRLEYSVRRNKVGATQLKLRAPLFGLAPVHAFVGALPIIAQRYPKS